MMNSKEGSSGNKPCPLRCGFSLVLSTFCGHCCRMWNSKEQQKDKNLGFLQGESRDPRHKLSEQHGLVTTRPSQFLFHRWDCEAQRGNGTSQTSYSNRLG